MGLDNYLVVLGVDINACRIAALGRGGGRENKKQGKNKDYWGSHTPEDKYAHRPSAQLGILTVDSCDTLG